MEPATTPEGQAAESRLEKSEGRAKAPEASSRELTVPRRWIGSTIYGSQTGTKHNILMGERQRATANAWGKDPLKDARKAQHIQEPCRRPPSSISSRRTRAR
jgi:hypothetical protein